MKSPNTEAELNQRALSLSGYTIAEIAAQAALPVPENLLHHKGWVGHLLEKLLGAEAGSKPHPDFLELGIELKTLPLSSEGKPLESTFVCAISLLEIGEKTWETSTVFRKLSRVLWIPIIGDKQSTLADRLVGHPIFWSPSPDQEQLLRQDWQELTDLLALGQYDRITAKLGHYLQIRPKAPNARALCWGLNESGERVLTLPRGFYLRTRFTEEILRNYF